MVTPLLPSGALDVESLDRLLEHFVSIGATGVLVLGSTGEVGMLQEATREEVLSRTVQRVKGRIHVMAGVPAMGTLDGVGYARRWSALGADSLLVTAPYAFQLAADELANHFRLIAGASPVPILAYNIPVRVQVILEPQLLATLAAEGTIQGVKDSSGDIQRARTLYELLAPEGEIRTYTGSEQAMESWLLSGAHGVIPGLANPFGRYHVELTRRATAGDWPGARAIQGQILSLLELYQYAIPGASFSASAVASMKEALVQQGIIAHSTMSPPFGQTDPGLRAHVERIVERARDLIPVAGFAAVHRTE